MKFSWILLAVLCSTVATYAHDSSSSDTSKHVITNDDISSSSPSSSTDSGAPATQVTPDSGESKPAGDSSQASGDDPAATTKPDRSNIVGDVPGYTPEPKDRIATLKVHASQWETMIANFEKKIAAEQDPEKRAGLETMLEHARQNQAKDAAEQQSLEKQEADKAKDDGSGSAPASGDQPTPESQQTQ
jgi:hypothetical protein